MTSESPRAESVMLEEVLRWRREAYDADCARTPQQRRQDRAKLVEAFGLQPPQRKSNLRRPPTGSV